VKRSDRLIVIGLGLAGLLAAFWFLAVAPKREKLSELDDEITSLEASVAEQEQVAAFAEEAKADYERDYHRLVVLGKAIPGDDDSASLIDQTQSLADRTKVDFRTLVLAAPQAETAPPAATQTTAESSPSGTPTSDTGGEAGATEGASAGTEGTAPAAGEAASAPATTAAVPATETAAAALPIGATVGSAGLPVLPYDLSFSGGFFEIADFMSSLDGMVSIDSKGIGVDGRLVTVDGFTLIGDQEKGFPHLNANLRVTTYVAPADQGATAGATPTEPAPVPGAPAAPAAPTTTSAPGAGAP
jgi:Tfp pilus assembly protein PilO